MRYFLLLAVILGIIFPQEEKSISKMDRFISNVGSIMKLENFTLPDVEGYNEVITSKVRRATSKDDVAYFLQFVKKDKYKSKVASIAEDDLRDVIKAMDNLILQSNNESSTANYLENKFTTEDGFQLGYGGADVNNLLWFMTLEKYGESTILFKEHLSIKKALLNGLDKINSLKDNK
jgi:hypothetical protein